MTGLDDTAFLRYSTHTAHQSHGQAIINRLEQIDADLYHLPGTGLHLGQIKCVKDDQVRGWIKQQLEADRANLCQQFNAHFNPPPARPDLKVVPKED